LHAYQVAVYAYGESPEDKEFLQEQEQEISADRLERAAWRGSCGVPEMGGMEAA
jgi:hypothetical protein